VYLGAVVEILTFSKKNTFSVKESKNQPETNQKIQKKSQHINNLFHVLLNYLDLLCQYPVKWQIEREGRLSAA